MQEEQEIYERIISDSAKKLLVLKTLSNFFNHKDLFAVYIRTKVIHNLFESNKNLDVNKLDLFHVQYTSSLADLFQKLKKSKEQQYLLMSDEVYINNDVIQKLEKEAEARDFTEEAKKHGALMSAKLKQLYAMLAGSGPQPTLSWGDVMMFSTRLGQEFYREITAEQYLKLTDNDAKKVYSNEYVVIERKLLGKLNILNFRVKFTCGLEYDNDYIEVFDFIDSNDRFIFIDSIKAFYLLDDEMAKGLDLSKNLSNKASIIQGLRAKNEMLKDKQATLKTSLPNDVQNVLAAYLDKISGVDFLEELQNVDEQTNILRAMLNININSK